jgi:hypothetical protein
MGSPETKSRFGLATRTWIGVVGAAVAGLLVGWLLAVSFTSPDLRIERVVGEVVTVSEDGTSVGLRLETGEGRGYQVADVDPDGLLVPGTRVQLDIVIYPDRQEIVRVQEP